MSPKIAVITPTKNRLKLLCEAIASVQSQTFSDWEHIIVDDGSDDGTPEEVRRLSALDSRITYIARGTEKSGANVCRNLGIRNSHADLIVFLDSDDLLRKTCLERRLEVMERNQDLDFAVFRSGIFINTVGDQTDLYHPMLPGDDLLRFLSHECIWNISSPVWRRAALEKIGCFDDALPSLQDLDLHVRAICAQTKYILLPDIDHDIRGMSDSQRTSTRHFKDTAYFSSTELTVAKLSALVRAAGLMTWSRQRALAGLYFNIAISWIRAGQVGQALRTWNAGCKRQKGSLLLRMTGNIMLIALCVQSSETGIFLRLANKWKGWVRFRQEPELLRNPGMDSDGLSGAVKSP